MPAPNSASGFVAPCEREIASSPERASRVFICEGRDSRFQVINRIVAECDSQSLQSADYSALNDLPASSRFGFAIIGLEECPAANSPALNAVRAFSRKGHIVICYADHARTWPLGERCNVLLAGALTLIDSARPEFSRELQGTLAQALSWETEKSVEETRTKNEMRSLGVIGESKAMLSIFGWVLRASALSDLSVLITGETGTGKELLGNAIYHLDRKRCRGPLIVLNCGAITAGVAESELFGHRRGAFTGADRDRPGLIRAANGGILFLDEIGDLDLGLQSKLLRVLQENRVLGVGEDQEVPVNIRVIAATNRNLEEMTRKGTFRADLFHRLNILSVHIPPLRQRLADLRPLAVHFIEKYRSLSKQKSLSLAPEFIEALTHLELSGNARELENLVRRALVNKVTDGPLGLSDLPREVLEELAGGKPEMTISHDPANAEQEPDRSREILDSADLQASLFQLLELKDGGLTPTLDHCERLLIAAALKHSNGNQSLVAKLLGITPRSVYNKLNKYRLR